MTTNDLLENINNKVHEFGFGYVLYHSLMEDISDCINDFELEYNKDINKLKQTNKQLYEALETLVNLKIHKETFGKNEYYESHRELAWDEAKVLINKEDYNG